MQAVNNLHGRWLRGLLESCVLSVLRSGPAYGYDIATRFEQAGFSRPKGGTLYPILARLENEGLVRPSWVDGEGGPSRKYYELTPDGAAAAKKIEPEWQTFAEQVSALLCHQKRIRTT